MAIAKADGVAETPSAEAKPSAVDKPAADLPVAARPLAAALEAAIASDATFEVVLKGTIYVALAVTSAVAAFRTLTSFFRRKK